MEGGSKQILSDGAHFGSYVLLRLLGKGGMAEVYLAEEPLSHSLFAIKILDTSNTSPQDKADIETRFIREAEEAIAIEHPNLVKVYEAAKDPDTGLYYLVMEYMTRGSCKELIAKGKEIPIETIRTITADVAAALAVLEAHGLVHRDIKPANILFASDGTAKLSDLGISRRTDWDREINVTRAEDVVGTPAYMSPEQMLDSRKADAKSDIYSLGMVLFELITLKRAFEGESPMRTLANALDGREPPDVRSLRPSCPEELALLAWAMMQPAREKRPENAREVLVYLTAPKALYRHFGLSPQVKWYEDKSVLYAVVAFILSLELLAVALVSLYTRMK